MRGSCLCGEIRYEIRGPLLGINYCHCSQCRKASGTAFGANAGVATEHFALTGGRECLASHESSPGKKRYFCRRCGSPVYSQHAAYSDRVYVRIGTLDDEPDRAADVHIHVASKASWYDITDQLPQIQREEGLDF